ncbi:MAG TPA: serine/threonine-protein kinase, partial [Ktedonobacteraceae bacterium]|nr:serine/threonine-protein kinase [Ktedonobacteraceae bacterium]
MDTEARRLGKYELREHLARGGQGEVWKAFDPRLQRYVAIKQLHANLQSDPDFISRFEREARFIASLHHPNIVQIHDFQIIQTPGSDATTAYMVMDYIEGSTLAHYIHNTSRKGQYPDAADLVYIFTAVGLAIDYAHERGMIHRDIKPANIMLDKRSHTVRSIGQPILTDFGIAKLQGAFADTTRVIGTPLYASPEQARGLSGDKRSDLYSLGVILYEMTTGTPPFRGDSPMAILMLHYLEIPTAPALINRLIPPALSEVILKSIAKDPDARFQSASAMTIALAEALNVPIPAELRKTASSPDLVSISHSHNPLQPSTPAEISPAWRAQGDMATAGSMAGASPATTILRQAIRRRRRLYIGLIAVLVVLVVGSSILYALSAPKGPTTPLIANPIVGHVDFLDAPPGTHDEVQIMLHGIPDAPSGKTYYAWLENGTPPVQWSFTAHNGSLSSPPYIDAQHRNLLAATPYLFLITLQSQATVAPSFDPNE